MGDGVGVSEQDVTLVKRPKKKWILISVIGVVFILLISGMLYWYAGYKFEREVFIGKEDVYKYYKCFEYCPTASVYSEKTTNVEPGIEKGFVEKINQECLNSCYGVNLRSPKEVEEASIRNSYINIFLSEERIDDISKNLPPSFPESSCMSDVRNYANKSCLKNYFLRNKEFYSEIIIPQYENVTMDITGLNCREDGFTINVNIIEGNIAKLVILPTYQGNFEAIYLDENEIGNHSIFISSNQYSGLKGVGHVGITYVVDDSTDPMRNKRDLITSRLCE